MPKPVLLFFQYKYDERLPPFLLIHKQEHVKCLEEFFKVIVVQEDCDFIEVCDRYQPDIALFESGVSHSTCKRLRITNVRGSSEVPKVALHHADAFCNAREGFISDIDHWGISTVFAISTTAGEHTPELASDLFYWPVFVDADVIRDYAAWKSIPVLATGNSSQFYPWRQAVFPLVSNRYPTLVCPHPGYDPKPGFNQTLVGERYARTLNAAWCVPACGTVAKEAVRKHFEVPGTRSCLVTERSPALDAAGFMDMKNCIFADASDVIDKLDWLFSNQDTLSSIIDAGYELVQSKHTHKQRNQIFEWYRQNILKTPNTKIIQPNPFQSPIRVEIESARETLHIASAGTHLQLIKEGDALFVTGRYEAAETAYRAAMNYMLWMPEPKLRAALCNLRLGDAEEARKLIYTSIEFTLNEYGAADPDPVEWAYYIVCLLCQGEVDRAADESERFPALRHAELQRVRVACARLAGRPDPGSPDANDLARRSIHVLSSLGVAAWDVALVSMLDVCGQSLLASEFLAVWGSDLAAATGSRQLGQRRVPATGLRRAVSIANNSGRWSFWMRSRIRKVKHELGNHLRRLERRFGYFLPFDVSAVREDEFIQRLCREFAETTSAGALILGADPKRAATQAAMFGLRRSRQGAKVYCVAINETPEHHGTAPNSVTNESVVHVPGGISAAAIAETILLLRGRCSIAAFNRVLVDCHVLQAKLGRHPIELPALGRAEIVYVCGTATILGSRLQTLLLDSAEYQSVVIDPVRGGGHSVFCRRERPHAVGRLTASGGGSNHAAVALGNP
jgi:tetratricopeptide (TPR) repeat protein